MPLTYGHDGTRLIAAFASDTRFAGFLTWDGDTRTEQLFAVDADGNVLSRTDRIGCAEFDGNGWTPCEAVPDHAQWIGSYPAPKARAALNGTRIATTERKERSA